MDDILAGRCFLDASFLKEAFWYLPVHIVMAHPVKTIYFILVLCLVNVHALEARNNLQGGKPYDARALHSLEYGSPKNPNFRGLKLQGTVLVRAQDQTQDIRLSTQNYYGKRSNVLYLDFDQPLAHLLRDQAGKFRILTANYIVSSKGLFGQRAALFNRKENKIIIRSSEELWPAKEELDSFNIEMWIKPVFFYRRNILLRKINFIYGRKRGIELSIEKGRLHFQAYGIFLDENERRYDFVLKSKDPVPRKEWSHIRVSYNEARSTLIMYINGEEKDRVLTRNASSGFWASFGKLDSSPIEVAPNYSGFLDEVRISSGALGSEEFHTSRFPKLKVHESSMRTSQTSGWAISEVLPVSRTQRVSHLKALFETKTPGASHIHLWVRYANRPFDADLDARTLAWKRIPQNRIVHLPSLRYLQWKAELRADPSGQQSPVLTQIRFSIASDAPPAPPAQFRVIRSLSRSGRICLEWEESPLRSVQTRGSYAIYLGLRPEEFAGRIFVSSRSPFLKHVRDPDYPMTNSEKKERMLFPGRFSKKHRNKIRFFLSNSLIEKNIKKTGRPLPLLTLDRNYYLSITSINHAGSESQLYPKINFYLESFESALVPSQAAPITPAESPN